MQILLFPAVVPAKQSALAVLPEMTGHEGNPHRQPRHFRDHHMVAMAAYLRDQFRLFRIRIECRGDGSQVTRHHHFVELMFCGPGPYDDAIPPGDGGNAMIQPDVEFRGDSRPEVLVALREAASTFQEEDSPKHGGMAEFQAVRRGNPTVWAITETRGPAGEQGLQFGDVVFRQPLVEGHGEMRRHVVVPRVEKSRILLPESRIAEGGPQQPRNLRVRQQARGLCIEKRHSAPLSGLHRSLHGADSQTLHHLLHGLGAAQVKNGPHFVGKAIHQKRAALAARLRFFFKNNNGTETLIAKSPRKAEAGRAGPDNGDSSVCIQREMPYYRLLTASDQGSTTRICIVGAGAAGLSAAWYLRKRGFSHVTLLERSGQAGGKCLSLEQAGGTIDLGAALLMPNYKKVLAIAAEAGAATVPVAAFRGLRLRDGKPVTQTVGQMVLERYSLLEMLRAGSRYLAAYRKHRAVLRRPGFAGMAADAPHSDLSKPFRQWVSENGMEPLLTQLVLPFAAFGYGDVGALSVAYVMRYIPPAFYLTMSFRKFFRAAGQDWPRRFARGFGPFWQQIAKRFDVRMHALVEFVECDRQVTVAWSEGSHGNRVHHREQFDALILACDPRVAGGFADWSADEAALFAKIRTKPYSVTVCEAEGLPASVSFVAEMPGPGRLIQFWKPEPGRGPCAFYTCPADGISPEEIMTQVRDDLRLFHPRASVGRILRHASWDYFPHVTPEDFADGFYDRFEALQGRRNVWYCGALAAFESIENVVAYSESLADRLVDHLLGNSTESLGRPGASKLQPTSPVRD